MIRPFSTSNQSKYRSWLLYYGLLLTIGVSPIQIQAASAALYAGKAVKPDNGLSSPAPQDQQTRELEPGKPIERELSGGQSHSYELKLAAGQYVKLIVDQRGIDVVLKLLGHEGKQIAEFDGEFRTQGQEVAAWVAEGSGSYRVDVQAEDKNAAAGRYKIEILELRVATEDDRALYEAFKLYTEVIRLYFAGRYDEARPLDERVLEIREMILGPEHRDVAASLTVLANIYFLRGEYTKAEPLYQRAAAVVEKVLDPEHPKVGQNLSNLANLYYKKADYAKAEPLYQRAIAIFEKGLGPEHPFTSSVLYNLAHIYDARSEFEKAEQVYQRTLTINEKTLGPDHPKVAQSLNSLSAICYRRGQYTKSEPLLRRALNITEKAFGPEHPEVATITDNLATLYDTRGDIANALALHQRTLNIREKTEGPEHPEVADSLNDLGVIYCDLGDYAQAERLFQRALTIREKALGPDHPDVGYTLINLASHYHERGNYGKAEPLYQRTLAIWMKALGSEHPHYARCLNHLGDLYRLTGDYEKAEPLYKRALAISEKALGPEHPDVAATLNGLAILLKIRGDHTKAEPLYWRALDIQEKAFGPGHVSFAQTLYNISLFYAAKGDLSQAITYLSRANDVDERNMEHTLALGSERQKLDYLSIFSQRTDYTLSLHSRAAANDPEALDLAFTTLLRRKGRGLDAMTDALAAFRRNATPEDQKLFDKLSEARSQLAAFMLKDPDKVNSDVYRKRVNELTDEVEKLEGDLSVRSKMFRAQSQPVTIDTVQAAIPPGSALVEFAYFTPVALQTEKPGPPRYLAYLLPAQGQPKWVDLGEAEMIDRLIAAWRNALRDPNRPVRQRARALDEKLMRPVRSLLSERPGDPRRLLIAPDGSLNLIPFAALVDEQNRYLVERYSISYLTSGRDLLRLQTSEPSKGDPLVVANPEFGRFATVAMQRGRGSGKLETRKQTRSKIDQAQIFFQPLPATEDEALAIKAMLPKASVLRREEATETSLKQASRPQILHIATHGFFLEYQAPAPAEDEKQNTVPQTITGPATGLATSYTVQIQAAPVLETAQERVKRLRAQNIDAYILKSKLKGRGVFFRVRIGNFPTHAEANKYGADLQGEGIAREFFVASYKPPQGDLLEPESTIANAATKPVNPAPVSALPANSQPLRETRSDLRLSKFAAQVKDPLLRSGLALAGANRSNKGDDDGILTALEVAYLDLLGTKLVVLSACDTGVGDVKKGEGVQGLRRALVVAGSESQVMSLWPVPDESTKDLMILYYKALQEGEGRSEGLRQVQLRMLRGNKNRRHPFYWAAFIQSGEWANLDGQR
jgi:CHAT domain-containing protein/Tfp pilus assembly protein PilF